MKFFSLIFLMLLIGCEPKETKPELDFVKIEMFPSLGGPPSNISIDLKNKLLTFSNLQMIGTYNENCEENYSNINTIKEFVYINLDEDEMNNLKSILNGRFLESIKKNNKSLLDNPKKYDGMIFDGITFELDIVKGNQVFSTDLYLILEREDEVKIYEILKIIKKHCNSEWNKKYFDNLSFYLTNFPDQSNYKQKFP